MHDHNFTVAHDDCAACRSLAGLPPLETKIYCRRCLLKKEPSRPNSHFCRSCDNKSGNGILIEIADAQAELETLQAFSLERNRLLASKKATDAPQKPQSWRSIAVDAIVAQREGQLRILNLESALTNLLALEPAWSLKAIYIRDVIKSDSNQPLTPLQS